MTERIFRRRTVFPEKIAEAQTKRDGDFIQCFQGRRHPEIFHLRNESLAETAFRGQLFHRHFLRLADVSDIL